MKKYFKTLGLEEGASQEEIKSAHSKLSKELNPANNNNQEFFKEEYEKVQAAYKALYTTSILATEKGAKNKKNVSKPNGKLEDKPPVSNPNLAKSKNNKMYLSLVAVLILVSLVSLFIYNQSQTYKSDQITIAKNLVYLKHDMSLLSGKVKDAFMAGFFIEGKREGVWREWYKNGQLQLEAQYKNGESEGLYRYWHENGQLNAEYQNKNGKPEGLYRHWHKNGQLSQEGQYKNGEKQGIYRSWNENGQLTQEGQYKNGEKQGLWVWEENGRLNRSKNYD